MLLFPRSLYFHESDVTNLWQRFKCIVKVGTQFPLGKKLSLFGKRNIIIINCLMGKQQTPQAIYTKSWMSMCSDENNEKTFPERRERGRRSVKLPLIVSTEIVVEGLWELTFLMFILSLFMFLWRNAFSEIIVVPASKTIIL